MEKLNIYQKLLKVQEQLRVSKGQWNKFGKYYFRSCEDILEAVKPLLAEVGAIITLEDNIIQIGDRYYIQVTTKFIDIETGENISNTALAREEDTKKGMDASQITGTASSYARKYALNGLLLIDDTKDADTNEYKKNMQSETESNDQVVENTIKQEESETIDANESLLENAKTYILPVGKYKGKTLEEINKTDRQYLSWYYKNGNNAMIKSFINLILINNT